MSRSKCSRNNEKELARKCKRIARSIVNVKQAKLDGECYTNEYDRAACIIYSFVTYCTEHRAISVTPEIVVGMLLGIVSSSVSGKKLSDSEYRARAESVLELIGSENGLN